MVTLGERLAQGPSPYNRAGVSQIYARYATADSSDLLAQQVLPRSGRSMKP